SVAITGGVAREGGVAIGGVIGASRTAERILPPAGVVIAVAFVISRRHLAPTRGSAQCEHEAGDDYGTARYSVHRLLPFSQRWTRPRDEPTGRGAPSPISVLQK